jgi:DNA polymerase III epsilon subunit-like protein
LTGIKTEFLQDKPFFSTVFKEFADFVGSAENIFCVWGTDDIRELFRNILFFNQDEDSVPKKYINVQKLACSIIEGYGNFIGLKNAVEVFQIPFSRPFHDALNDALYTAEIFKVAYSKQKNISKFVQTASIDYVKSLTEQKVLKSTRKN